LCAVLVSLAVGATAGALLHIHAPVYAPVLPFVITVGVVATAARVFSDLGLPRLQVGTALSRLSERVQSKSKNARVP
jgi:hypothetical protein